MVRCLYLPSKARAALSHPRPILDVTEPLLIPLGVGLGVAVEIPQTEADESVEKRRLDADLGDVRPHVLVAEDGIDL
jgi:hypothetical protein